MCRELEEFKRLHEESVCKFIVQLRSLPGSINKKSPGKVRYQKPKGVVNIRVFIYSTNIYGSLLRSDFALGAGNAAESLAMGTWSVI